MMVPTGKTVEPCAGEWFQYTVIGPRLAWTPVAASVAAAAGADSHEQKPAKLGACAMNSVGAGATAASLVSSAAPASGGSAAGPPPPLHAARRAEPHAAATSARAPTHTAPIALTPA